MMNYKYIDYFTMAARVIAAVILFQTLFFKFTAAPESVYIFTKIGLEPWGRYTVGIIELIAATILLIPKLAWLGAIVGIGIMSGALFFHFTTLGFEVMNDGGYLFILCLIVFALCGFILIQKRNDIPFLNHQPTI